MRQDYCPIGGAPCQSMCDEPCLSTAKKRIAELEKDCEILQTNLDAALMQVKQLREALCRCQGWVKAYGEPETKAIVCKALEQTK